MTETTEIQVPDHGYVKLIETYGSDERVVEAARMSTGKGFLGWGPQYVCSVPGCGAFVTITPDVMYDEAGCANRHYQNADEVRKTKQVPGDEKLLAFLYSHQHATPFEMAGMIIEVQAPIFVFREWHRHRTQSYNELSARYTPLPSMHYVPTADRLLVNSKTNKQAGVIAGAAELTEDVAEELMREERAFNEAAERFYQKKLSAGVPKELARTHLGVSRYSRMRANANLRNWLAFLTLRSDKNPAAQWEIRQYANAVGVFVKEAFPRTYELFARPS